MYNHTDTAGTSIGSSNVELMTPQTGRLHQKRWVKFGFIFHKEMILEVGVDTILPCIIELIVAVGLIWDKVDIRKLIPQCLIQTRVELILSVSHGVLILVPSQLILLLLLDWTVTIIMVMGHI